MIGSSFPGTLMSGAKSAKSRLGSLLQDCKMQNSCENDRVVSRFHPSLCAPNLPMAVRSK